MLELNNINKSYQTGDFVQHALSNVNLKFRKCEFVAVLGSSGSGKTTLLNILGGLDRYDKGDLIINNKSTKKFKSVEWDYYRNNCVGFIFQSYNLISHISVLENVEMALILSGYKKKDRKVRALDALDRVGLRDHAHKKPNQLSGGQMQRVAIARALVNDPEIILADEPTGALDSVTSVQIMDLIKEIAKDKLVIMVTHNPELAKDYATRVIELKDGKILSDSNPLDDKSNSKEKLTIKKTVLGYGSALKLSFNNIKTKKGRTFLTSFAASIGIIGIALILSLSNGFKIKIDEYERDALSQMPITITSNVMNMSSETMNNFSSEDVENEEYSSDKVIHPKENKLNSMLHINKLDSNYIDYIEKIDKSNLNGISYDYGTVLNVITKKDNGTYAVVPTSTNYSISNISRTGVEGWSLVPDNFLDKYYDVLAGSIDNDTPGIVIAVNSRNELDKNTLELLGFDASKDISFDDILSKEFKVIPNDFYYQEFNGYFAPSTDYENMYNNEEAITIKVQAIIRTNKDKSEITTAGIIYNDSLVKTVINRNKDSAVVNRQKEVDYNVLTGQEFNDKTSTVTKENILGVLGAEVNPSIIYLYPKDFNAKDYVTGYLDNYNDNKDESEQVLYTDYASLISILSGSIMDAVTYVLIAFSSISLIVSCIMIAIITYISVLERTKEIGILRALGARGKDITRVFNAETFIIGVCSGALGLFIAYLLTIPINTLIERLADLPNVARLNPVHGIILLIISVTLTVISGFVPSKMASKKDPVIALRTE